MLFFNKKNKSFCWLFICLYGFLINQLIESAKILGFFTTPSVSHHIINKSLMKTLASRGHEIAYVSMFPSETINLPGYRQINIASKEDNEKLDLIRSLLMQKVDDKENQLLGFYSRSIAVSTISNNSLNHPLMKELMAHETFDLIVFGLFMNDFAIGVAGHFKCPIVVLSTMASSANLRNLIGNPADIPHAPTLLFDNIDPTKFLDRLKNCIFHILENIVFSMLDRNYHKPLYRYNFPSDEYPTYEKMKKNISLVLLNSHYSRGAIRSLVPNMVEVGGMHINISIPTLPADIQEWLDDAPNGLVYFSLGTNLNSFEMTATKQASILHGFSKIKAKVLMKWETDNIPINVTKNIMFKKWLSQEAILNHKNTRLFVSHCGAGSINEAIFYGVPVLGLPIFADQFNNLDTIVLDGMGVGLPFSELKNETFAKLLNELLDNPKYIQRAKTISQIYRDRPDTPMNTAIYWIEYVLKHKGAPFMQSPLINYGFFEYYLIDIILFCLAIIILLVFILKIIFIRLKYKIVLGFQKTKIH